jgi:hypothetical protein
MWITIHTALRGGPPRRAWDILGSEGSGTIVVLDWLVGRFRRGGNRRGVRRGAPTSRDRHVHTQQLSAPPPLPQLNPELYPPPPPPVSHQPGPPPPYATPQLYTPLPPTPPPPQYSPVQYAPLQTPVQPPIATPNDGGQTRLITVPAAPRGAVVAVLIGISGRLSGEVYKVHDGENRMGRLKGAEIALDGRDDTISREHAVIIHREGAFGLKPLRPDNPTWVNGEQVDEGTPLSDGDQIRVGQSTFRFRTA